MRVSIKALNYFLHAAEHGSIAKAAAELNVVPSAISNAIDLVEGEFELQLVQRYPAKGIRPTAAGLAMMRRIRHLVEEYDTLFLEGTELRTALSGSLTIGYYAPVAPAFMPAIVAPLVREHPGIKVNLVETDNERAQAGLLDGEFDLILFVAENVRAGIDCQLLIDAPPYVLVPHDHALRHREYVTRDGLGNEPLVLLNLPMTDEYYRGLAGDASRPANIVATASTHEMVRSLVGAGVGCSILNMRPATAVTYAGDEVFAIPFRTDAQALKLALGHLDGRPRRLVQAFMDATRDHFALASANDLIVPS
ncbi:LysR substrate-binding domain-containing protein [Anderseniella sp. Alg231-50]|uniref:LysR substrate-binding domain-containing protein n=1 Tax=Anderseniella sp. Alg231-50 TaxID=1922226 RepID=UPI000D55FBA5